MDFYIRIWDNDEVKSRYLDSKFVGHRTADDMLEEFNTVLEGLNPRNLIQISMDGPSVNWKFHRSMQSQMETNYGKSLLDCRLMWTAHPPWCVSDRRGEVRDRNFFTFKGPIHPVS